MKRTEGQLVQRRQSQKTMNELPIRKKQPIKKKLTPRKEGTGSPAMGTRSKVPVYLPTQLTPDLLIMSTVRTTVVV